MVEVYLLWKFLIKKKLFVSYVLKIVYFICNIFKIIYYIIISLGQGSPAIQWHRDVAHSLLRRKFASTQLQRSVSLVESSASHLQLPL